MFKKFMQKRMKLAKNQKGVTLIELMAVVVILGIIAAVGGAAITGVFSDSKKSADKTAYNILYDATQRYVMDGKVTATGTIAASALLNDGYISSIPKVQNVENTTQFTITYTAATASASAKIEVSPSIAQIEAGKMN